MEPSKAANVAGVVLRFALECRTFSTMDIMAEVNIEVTQEDVNEILRQLQRDGWITEESEGSIWRAGHLTLELGDMVAQTKDQEGMIPVLPDERTPSLKNRQ